MTMIVLNSGGQLVQLDMATWFWNSSPGRPGFDPRTPIGIYDHITSYSHVYQFLSGLAENIFRWPLGWHFCNFWHIFSSKKCGQILVSIVPSFACFVQTSREIILQGEQNRSWKVYNCIPRIVYQALISQKRVEFLKCRYHDQNLHFSIKTPKSFIFWDAKWTKFHPYQFFYQTVIIDFQ